jgi:hypothetical protein
VFSINGTVCTGQPPANPQLSVPPQIVGVPEGGSATYGVQLTARPSGTVEVTSTAGVGDSSITVTAGATLTFTPANWQVVQNVRLSAAEDADSVTGNRIITVSAPGMNPVMVNAIESENDICICPPVTPTAVNVPEGGSGTFTAARSSCSRRPTGTPRRP